MEDRICVKMCRTGKKLKTTTTVRKKSRTLTGKETFQKFDTIKIHNFRRRFKISKNFPPKLDRKRPVVFKVQTKQWEQLRQKYYQQIQLFNEHQRNSESLKNKSLPPPPLQTQQQQLFKYKISNKNKYRIFKIKFYNCKSLSVYNGNNKNSYKKRLKNRKNLSCRVFNSTESNIKRNYYFQGNCKRNCIDRWCLGNHTDRRVVVKNSLSESEDFMSDNSKGGDYNRETKIENCNFNTDKEFKWEIKNSFKNEINNNDVNITSSRSSRSSSSCSSSRSSSRRSSSDLSNECDVQQKNLVKVNEKTEWEIKQHEGIVIKNGIEQEKEENEKNNCTKINENEMNEKEVISIGEVGEESIEEVSEENENFILKKKQLNLYEEKEVVINETNIREEESDFKEEMKDEEYKKEQNEIENNVNNSKNLLKSFEIEQNDTKVEQNSSCENLNKLFDNEHNETKDENNLREDQIFNKNDSEDELSITEEDQNIKKSENEEEQNECETSVLENEQNEEEEENHENSETENVEECCEDMQITTNDRLKSEVQKENIEKNLETSENMKHNETQSFPKTEYDETQNVPKSENTTGDEEEESAEIETENEKEEDEEQSNQDEEYEEAEHKEVKEKINGEQTENEDHRESEEQVNYLTSIEENCENNIDKINNNNESNMKQKDHLDLENYSKNRGVNYEDYNEINFSQSIEKFLDEYDHNRLLSQQQQNGNLKSGSNSTVNGGINTTNRIKDNNSTIIVATNSPLSVCNGNSPTSGTKLRNGNLSHTTTTTTTAPHGVSNHGSPNNLQKKHLQSQQQPGQQNKTLQSQHYQKQHQQQQQQQQQQRQQQEQKLQELNTIQQQQQQQTTCKTSLLDLSIPDGNKSIEALGVLLQYLVYDLDAFACPSIKQDYSQSQKNLFQTQSLLDDARTACSDLQDQLSDKDHFYMTREQELQTLHRCELTKVETSLKDFQTNANERIAFLQLELSRKDEEHIKKFNSLQQKSDSKIQQLEKDLERARSNEIDLLKRIEILISNENELRDRIQEAEDSFTERLQASVQLERDLADKVTTLTRQLELTRLESEKRERELEEKLNLSQNELTIIRNNQNFMVSLNNSSSSSITSSPLNHQQQQQNSSTNFNNDDDIIKLRSPKTISQIHGGGSHNNVMSLSMSSNSSNKVQMLENEVESLRSVMDIKLNDICELRKKNQELTRANEEFEGLKIKYSGMESRLEDLQIQLRAKDEEKQELLFKIKHLQEQCAQEAKNRTRVLLHNEELQYRLKQNSEKFNAFVAELSKSEYASCSKGLLSQDNLDLSQISSLNSNISINNINNITPLRSNGASGNIISGLTFEEEDSPPGSPIIKGVVKKSDSVSWVLQMDDELPEVVASRMVKRAGSFRSSFNEKVQNAKRQLSLPNGPGSINGGNNCSPNINPLQQSASATMLNPQNHQKIVTQQRQHSNSESEYGSISSPRIRSKSINIKGCDQKKQLKQTSNGGSVSKKIEVPGLWKEPICSSSPYARHASKFQKTSHSPPKSQLTATSAPLVKQISKSYSQDEDDVNDTVCKNNDEGAGSFSGNIYNRKNSRHLITNDKTASTQNERLSSTSSLPTHASVQDLKSLKKSQPQILESAGEAMVSGTNSEDDSGSSDESPCQSQSMSSDTNSSNSNSESDHHHHHLHQQHKINSLAIEEALLLDKYANSLDGTPMEVSWSSDADAFPPESIV